MGCYSYVANDHIRRFIQKQNLQVRIESLSTPPILDPSMTEIWLILIIIAIPWGLCLIGTTRPRMALSNVSESHTMRATTKVKSSAPMNISLWRSLAQTHRDPVSSPAAAILVTTLPTIRSIEFGAAAQSIEPTPKIRRERRYVSSGSNKV